jgi:hypothetical protein
MNRVVTGNDENGDPAVIRQERAVMVGVLLSAK